MNQTDNVLTMAPQNKPAVSGQTFRAKTELEFQPIVTRLHRLLADHESSIDTDTERLSRESQIRQLEAAVALQSAKESKKKKPGRPTLASLRDASPYSADPILSPSTASTVHESAKPSRTSLIRAAHKLETAARYLPERNLRLARNISFVRSYYGLAPNGSLQKPMTLDEIGKTQNPVLTRERVRQVIESTVAQIRGNALDHSGHELAAEDIYGAATRCVQEALALGAKKGYPVVSFSALLALPLFKGFAPSVDGESGGDGDTPNHRGLVAFLDHCGFEQVHHRGERYVHHPSVARGHVLELIKKHSKVASLHQRQAKSAQKIKTVTYVPVDTKDALVSWAGITGQRLNALYERTILDFISSCRTQYLRPDFVPTRTKSWQTRHTANSSLVAHEPVAKATVVLAPAAAPAFNANAPQSSSISMISSGAHATPPEHWKQVGLHMRQDVYDAIQTELALIRNSRAFGRREVASKSTGSSGGRAAQPEQRKVSVMGFVCQALMWRAAQIQGASQSVHAEIDPPHQTTVD